MDSIFIYGAGGHGRVVADIAQAIGFQNIFFVDDGDNDYPALERLTAKKNMPIALGIGDNNARKIAYRKAKELGFCVETLIHPTAIVSPSAIIGEGTVVMPGAIVNADSKVGQGVILNTACIIEHDNVIGPFAHISPGVALAGNVTIGESVHIGIGSCVIQGIRIGDDCIVGAGSTVVSDLQSGMLCYGSPCKPIKEID